MSRVYVLSQVPANQYNVASAKLCDIYGDDFGTDEFSGLNASASGDAPGTNAVCSAGGLTPAQADDWQNFLVASVPGSGSARFTDIPEGGFWAQALTLWGLKQVAQ